MLLSEEIESGFEERSGFMALGDVESESESSGSCDGEVGEAP